MKKLLAIIICMIFVTVYSQEMTDYEKYRHEKERIEYPNDEEIFTIVEDMPKFKGKKPVEFRDLIIDVCGDLPRLEMFARGSSQGWDVFGNEAPNSISIGLK